MPGLRWHIGDGGKDDHDPVTAEETDVVTAVITDDKGNVRAVRSAAVLVRKQEHR